MTHFALPWNMQQPTQAMVTTTTAHSMAPARLNDGATAVRRVFCLSKEGPTWAEFAFSEALFILRWSMSLHFCFQAESLTSLDCGRELPLVSHCCFLSQVGRKM